MKLCPFCAEEIQDAAIKCKHCGSILTQDSTKSDQVQSVATDKARLRMPLRSSQMVACSLTAVATGYGTYYVVAVVGSKWGWALAAVALVTAVAAFLRSYGCLYCGHENAVAAFANNDECERCKTLHIIDWDWE